MKKSISSRMFDLRPVKETGDLDVERMKKVDGFLDLRYERWTKKKNQNDRFGNVSKPRRKKIVLNQETISPFKKISVEDFRRFLN